MQETWRNTKTEITWVMSPGLAKDLGLANHSNWEQVNA